MFAKKTGSLKTTAVNKKDTKQINNLTLDCTSFGVSLPMKSQVRQLYLIFRKSKEYKSGGIPGDVFTRYSFRIYLIVRRGGNWIAGGSAPAGIRQSGRSPCQLFSAFIALKYTTPCKKG